MGVMFAFLAFSVDLGYLVVARTELQRSADSAAIAATWDLLDEGVLRGESEPAAVMSLARLTADRYAGLNAVAGGGSALAYSDVTIGHMATTTSPMVTETSNAPNAVEVRIRRTSDQNGEVPFFFARLLGVDGQGAEATATAAFLNSIRGFQSPADGQNVNLLPFALDLETWTGLINGSGVDEWRWDAATNSVVAGPDGVREVNLFPQGTGSPGNRGTVDIGSPNNSTKDIARQILHGISPQDLACMGGKIELNAEGKLSLNGDTGISAGVKDELSSIRGQPRVIPVFESVSGNGNNAQYSIVRFAGIRIMEVKLTGGMSTKRVMVQPALVRSLGAIPSAAPTSDFVHSPVWLVR
jgi:hypothetical protein